MGCMGSRFDKRKDASGDMNTVGLQFMGGEGNVPDNCPVDRLVMAYCGEGKELADVIKPEDEEFAKKVAGETYNACVAYERWLKAEYGEDGEKKVLVGEKHDLKDALANLKSVQEAIVAAGFDVAPKEEEKKDDMAMEGEMAMEAEMMEGGEDMDGEMAMDAMMSAANDLYKDDAEDYAGSANLGKLLLAQSVKAPYFGDLIKRQLVIAEFDSVATGFGGLSLPKVEIPEVPMPEAPGVPLPAKKPKDTVFAGASAVISAYVDSAEGDAKDIWFSGFAGDEDLEALKGLAAEKGPIVFPGWLSGWRSEEDAKKNVGEYGGSQAGAKVLFKINAKCLEAVVCRSFIQRLSATVDSTEEADGWNTFALTEKPFTATTIAAWNAAAGAAPAGEAMEEEKKEEEKKEEEAAPEMAAE
jgi:hypothetical protein